MKITMQNIANLCGVSRGTVDRALNNRPGINRETKERILRIATECGYFPDRVAASLSTGKTNTIGIIVFDLAHTFFSELVSEMISAFRERGFATYTAVTRKDPDEEEFHIRQFAALRVDGIVIVPISTSRRFNQVVKRVGIPVVTVLNYISKIWPYVGINDEEAIASAINCIINRDYHDIVYVSPPLNDKSAVNSYSVEHRAQGFRTAIKKTEINTRKIIQGQDYLEQAIAVYKESEDKLAFLCSSDHFALELLHYMNKQGIEIPRDVGIMGFDNISILEYIQPRLATIEINRKLLALQSVEILLDIIEGNKENTNATIPYAIIPGESL